MKNKEISMQITEEVRMITDLEALEISVQKMDLDKFPKEKILKTIEFEIDIMRRDVIKELGTTEYEKIKKYKGS